MKFGRTIRRKAIDHKHLCAISPVRPTDYREFGGAVERWADPQESYPDCSGGCKWAAWLEPPFDADWCVCAKPGGPREGLLTFEHQAGHQCFEDGLHYSDDRAAIDRAAQLEREVSRYVARADARAARRVRKS